MFYLLLGKLVQLLKKAQSHSEALATKADEMTAKHFRTAMDIIYNNLPFRYYSKSISLQERNHGPMGTSIRTPKSAAAIIKFIATRKKEGIIKDILNNQRNFSVLVDESTTYSNTTGVTIDIKYLDDNGNPKFIFWDLVEPKLTTAKAIADCIQNSLHCFPHEFLKKHFVGLGGDGASVISGVFNGVGALLKEDYENIEFNHCLAHRLELSVARAIRNSDGFQEYSDFSKKLYAFYSRSPKLAKELKTIAENLGDKLLSVKRILDVRWAASSKSAIESLMKNLRPLLVHLTKYKKQMSTKFQQMRKKSKGYEKTHKKLQLVRYLAKKLGDFTFVKKLTIMGDCFKEISELSLFFQSNNMQVMDVWGHITATKKNLAALIENIGALEQDFNKQYFLCGTYNGVRVINDPGDDEKLENEKCMFINALIMDLTERFKDSVVLKYAGMLKPQNWPKKDTERAHYCSFELYQLCNKFNMETQFQVVHRQFREWMTSGIVGQVFQQLIQKLNVLAFSSAQCERDFSAMNRVWRSERSRFNIETVSWMLFLKTNLPSEEFESNIGSYVKSWNGNSALHYHPKRSCKSKKKQLINN